MKLHLPKAVILTLLAVGMLQTYATAGVLVELETGTSTAITYSDGDLTVGTGDMVGALDANGELITSFSSSVYTNDLTIKGNLIINGTGIVAVGGQASSNNQQGVSVGASYTVTVNGDAGSTNLISTYANIANLVINSGGVSLHGGLTGGSGYIPGPKTAMISNALTLNGGTLSMGTTGAQPSVIGGQAHYLSALGGASNAATVMQKGGTMRTYGDVVATTGLSLTQEGGNMAFRDRLVFTGTNGNVSTITQRGGEGASLIIGHLADDTGSGFFKPKTDVKLDIAQEGAGNIKLAYGSNFTNVNGIVNIKQTGTGKIYIGGGINNDDNVDLSGKHFSQFTSTNTTYTIDQENSSGTVNLASNAEINATSLKQGANATLNINGTLNLSGTDNVVSGVVTLGTAGTLNLTGALEVESGSTLHFDVAAKDRAAINAAESGNLTVIASTVSVSMSETLQSTMESEAMEKLETLDSFTYTIDLIKLSSADSEELAKLIDDEQLVLSMALPQTMATASEDLDYTITQGLQVEGNVLQATVTWQAVKAEEQIPEPATATLSLLALAGLAARRRRR